MRFFLPILCLVVLPALAETVVVTATISQAIAVAQSGDTVMVKGPAVFRERIVIAKSLRLVGTNAPILDAGGSGTAVSITAPDVEIRGLTIRDAGRNLGAFDAGILVSGPRATIRDCRIVADGFGIYLRGASECVVESNTISGSKALASAQRGNGIHLWKTRGNELNYNRIHDKRDGLYLSYADANLIHGNRITETRFGIHLMYSHQNRLFANSLTANSVGATLMFSRQSLIQGNLSLANRRHGMVFKQLDRSVVANNVVAGQNRGFFVQQATQNRFLNNVVATNDIGLYLSNASEENVFVGNAFIRNADQVWQPPFETEQGQQGPNRFTEEGLGNFWSDYAGEDRNHDGRGDTAYHETDVFGYILDRYPQARVYAMSPAVALLRKGQELMPLLDTTGVTDTSPLISPQHLARVTSPPGVTMEHQ